VSAAATPPPAPRPTGPRPTPAARTTSASSSATWPHRRITVYEDFQCPICRAFEQATAAKVRAAVEAGEVKVEYRVVSFLDRASKNEYSSRAANAAMTVLDTAGIDAFWTFHDELFANQPEEGTAGPSNDDLVDLAVEAGADRAAVEAGIDDGSFDQWVKNATDAMSRHGVTGTPTALIDGEVAGQSAQETIEAVLAAVS
jgi:protein-disulfide isomerase